MGPPRSPASAIALPTTTSHQTFPFHPSSPLKSRNHPYDNMTACRSTATTRTTAKSCNLQSLPTSLCKMPMRPSDKALSRRSQECEKVHDLSAAYFSDPILLLCRLYNTIGDCIKLSIVIVVLPLDIFPLPLHVYPPLSALHPNHLSANLHFQKHSRLLPSCR